MESRFFIKVLLLTTLFEGMFGLGKGYSQVQDFEESFAIVNHPAEFLENWSAIEVRSTAARVFQASGKGRLGSKALAVQPISSFNGIIYFKTETQGKFEPKIAFFAKSEQNGTGNRPAGVEISFAKSAFDTFQNLTNVGNAQTFPNQNTEYKLFEIPIPEDYYDLPELVVKIEVKYGPGTGSSARFFMDDFGIFDGDEIIDPIQIKKAVLSTPFSFEIILDREIKSISKEQVTIGPYQITELLSPTDSSFVVFSNALIENAKVPILLENMEDKDGRVTEEIEFELDNSYIKMGNVRVPKADQIAINFSQFFLPASVSQTSNFLINGKNPTNVELSPNGFEVLLDLSEELPLKGIFQISISNLQNLNGTQNPEIDLKSLVYDDFVEEMVLIDNQTIQIKHHVSLSQKDHDYEILENPEFTFETSFPTSKEIELKSNLPFEESIVYTLNLPARSTERGYPIPGSSRDFVWDITHPSLVNVIPVSTNKILGVFSEPLDVVFASILSNYSISSSNPNSVLLFQNGNQALIEWGFDFEVDQEYNFQINGIADLNGNFLSNQSFTFLFDSPTKINFKDLVINEIMPAPRTGNSLPNVEYIELFNPGEQSIYLGGMQLANSKRKTTLPAFFLGPNEYLILTPRTSASQFGNFGPVLGLTSWPTLLNSGDQVKILDGEDNVIDSLAYSTATFGSSVFAQGGYSLEVVNPYLDCNISTNLKPSIDPKRGTPGKPNSVFEEIPDLIPLKFLQSKVMGEKTVVLEFSKILNQNISLTAFEFKPSIPIKNFMIGGSPNELVLEFEQNIQEGIYYESNVSNLRDCTGNLFESDQKVFFVIPSFAQSGDLVLNEILFNPRTGAPKFVEIYNSSQKYINLKDWKLANLDDENQVANRRVLFNEEFLIAPNSFLVFTTDSEKLKQEYPKSREGRFVEFSSIPSYPISEGNVVFLSPDETISEVLSYSDKMHHRLLKETKGISLERLSPFQPIDNPNNWHSASSTEGFATPGYQNSNVYEGNSQLGIEVDPKVFVPDAPGTQPYTTISYKSDQPGKLATIRIYGVDGTLVRELVQNAVWGNDGFYLWDGTQSNGAKVRAGIYIIWVEIFDLEGNVDQIRKTVVVGTKFQ
ncbi:lamin tail domain-containing protein [Aquiflexum gelatinilyticum]|uniref:Lamin tail domain-containing protein n=1 Tax=Aquiflexum gelatinilyticum TaxID=2961943 RepID=A0A9X2P1Y4_9BACT|nr:lamin tail domain-containing protein [Aquiflexum gelatinilyticum]MCR9014214.1 lamin tail domain-containing protein [Aquiflexum gelatinilyticum]MCS4433652.1 lamin tail domain-containing protein [Aquiflexum gelatinilyticum]